MTERHTAYIETLAHMNCGECGEYWGLSDLSADTAKGQVLYCPHCGHKAPVEEVVDGVESE